MNVIGLDLSLRATGVATATGARVVPLCTQRGAARLKWVQDHVREALGGCVPGDLAMIEGYSYGSVNGGERIGELGGVIRMLLFHRGIRHIEVPPGTLKLFATGKGNADKEQMIAAALSFGAALPYKERKDTTRKYDDNAADAWWLRQLGLYQQDKSDVAVTDQRDAVVAGLDWSAVLV